MKSLIIYCSKSGHTKKYAELLHSEIDSDIVDIRHVKKFSLKEYSTIIFGGSIYNNTINGCRKFIKLISKFQDKNLLVFAVGMSQPTEDVRDLLIVTNALDDYHIRFYQLPGGFDIKSVPFPYNVLMKMMAKHIARKKDASRQEKDMAIMINGKLDMVDKNNLTKMVNVVRSLH